MYWRQLYSCSLLQLVLLLFLCGLSDFFPLPFLVAGGRLSPSESQLLHNCLEDIAFEVYIEFQQFYFWLEFSQKTQNSSTRISFGKLCSFLA